MSEATTIRGLAPHETLRPADEAALSALLEKAGAERAACYIGGGLTKQDWGAAPDRIDLLIDMGDLSGCSDVDPDNLTLSAAAGTTVAEARARAAAVGRVLPLDPGRPGRATIGGVVATGDQGARGAGYGGLRDVVLGVRATLADGTAVKFGGRTMKNVTGYDMTKLFVGSFGALGVITEVTFRLLPRADSQALVILPLPSLEEGKASVARILGSYLQPLALEVVSADALPPDHAARTAKLPAGRAAAPATGGAPIFAGRPLLLAGFGGHRAVVERSVREVIGAHPGIAAQVLRDEAAEALWEHLAASAAGAGEERPRPVLDPERGPELGLRASVPISRALDVVAAARDHAAANGLALGYRAGTARGRVDLLFSGGTAAAAAAGAPGAAAEGAPHAGGTDFGACLTHMRGQAAGMGGSLIVTGGAGWLPAGHDAWGDVGGSLAIMKRIKERFDPLGILNPGRFVGGV